MCSKRLKTNDHIAITVGNLTKIVVARDEKLDFEQTKQNAFKG
jgi:hypothetical protein